MTCWILLQQLPGQIYCGWDATYVSRQKKTDIHIPRLFFSTAISNYTPIVFCGMGMLIGVLISTAVLLNTAEFGAQIYVDVVIFVTRPTVAISVNKFDV